MWLFKFWLISMSLVLEFFQFSVSWVKLGALWIPSTGTRKVSILSSMLVSELFEPSIFELRWLTLQRCPANHRHHWICVTGFCFLNSFRIRFWKFEQNDMALGWNFLDKSIFHWKYNQPQWQWNYQQKKNFFDYSIFSFSHQF